MPVPPRHTGRLCRIAMITYAHAEPPYSPQLDMAQHHLTRLGHVAGENAEYRRFFGNRDRALTARHAREIVDWGADVVLSFMTNADLEMIEATRQKRIPIVCWSLDPVGGGLVESAQRPGGNLTAVTLAPGFQSQQLRLLRAVKPDIDRVGYLHNPTYAIAPAALQHMHEAAALFRIAVDHRLCLDAGLIEEKIVELVQSGAQAILVGPHELLGHNGARIAAAATAHGIPSIGLDPFGAFGYVGSLVPDFPHVWEAAAALAHRILGGEDPADIPIARHIKPLMTLDLRAIARLGLQAPDWLMAEADQIFEA